MKIDPKAEDLGREAVVAAIGRNQERFLAAVDAISNSAPKTAEQVLPIYVGVARLGLLSVYKGQIPSENQNRKMADEIIESEAWAPLVADDVHEFLEGLSVAGHDPQIPVDRFPTTVFVTVAYILSSYRGALGFDDFYDLLDALEAQLDT
jgi:hypothetical protein